MLRMCGRFKGKRASRWARERIDSWRHQNKANCDHLSITTRPTRSEEGLHSVCLTVDRIVFGPQTGWGLWFYNICKFGPCLHNRNLVAWPHSQQCHQYSWVQLSKKRQDWQTHGGFCIYIKKGLKYTVLEDLYDDKIEAIWLQLRLLRLPRGLSCIIIANVYHPQTDKGISDPEILHYLYDSISTIELRFSNCGVLITGDFNRLNTSRFRNAFKLKQIVKFDTRPHFDQHWRILWGANKTTSLLSVRARICWTPALVLLQNTTFKTIDHYKRPAGKSQGHSKLILGKS